MEVIGGWGHLLLEEVPLLQGECVGLSDDRDDVHHLAQTPHELNIQRAQAGEREREEGRGSRRERHREIAEETQGERQAHRHDFDTYTRVF